MKSSPNNQGSAALMDALVFNRWLTRWFKTAHSILFLIAFCIITLPLMLVQYIFVRLNLAQARSLPHVYHKIICRLLGVRVNIVGEVEKSRPVLFVSNHISWLDIPILSTIAPLSFVAKAEVGTWPFISLMAKLQRTVFIDRNRRTLVKYKAGEIAERLAQGDNVVLFAEGTSSDGNRVLPFRSSLFSAAALAPQAANDNGSRAVIQTVAISYTHLHGLPILRHERPLVAWYGEMDMLTHVWNVIKSGPMDVTVRIGKPVALGSLRDRKELASFSEAQVRRDYLEQLTARSRAA